MKTMRLLVAFILLIGTTQLSAQQRTKMCFQLMEYLERQHAPDAQVDVFIHGAADELRAAVRAHGGIVKQALPRLVNARVPVAEMHALAEHSAVEQFEFSMEQPVLLNDSARVKSRVNEVHMGMAPLPQGYQGEGVIMGIIDTGLDVTHPDFQDEDGNTRVYKLWDQLAPVGPLTPPQYGYGRVVTSEHIDTGEIIPVDGNGHGTSVAGIAAGNGLANGMHKGMAPKTDLIIVKNPTGGANFYSTVVDAVEFIFDEAEALGKPAVVNISLGSRMGSHDGLDAAAQMIDAMILARSGRVVVCAGGNFNGMDPYHLRTFVDADTSFTWFQYNPAINFGGGILGGVYFEAWADAPEFENVQYAIGADRVSPFYAFRGNTSFHNVSQNVGTLITDTLYSTSGMRLGVANFLVTPRGGQYRLQAWMVQPDSSQYVFRLMTTGAGKFDVWSQAAVGWSQMLPTFEIPVPTVAEYPAMVNYVYPDNEQHITDSWTCSPHVITVANYRNETGYLAYNGEWQQGLGIVEGEITASSSKGPTRDDRIKPDIAGPGDVSFSAYPIGHLNYMLTIPSETVKIAPGGMHIRGGGTSATSPHVAGIVALYLEKCPLATHEEVRAALFSTAVADEFTGEVPNSTWGVGKVDAFAALNTSNVAQMEISVLGNLPFCEGDEVVLAGPPGFEEYTWSNGDSGNTLQLSEEATISLIAYNASYCSAYSDTIVVNSVPAPVTPMISTNGNVLTSSGASSYQWYFNGSPILGAVFQVHEAWETGNYTVEVTNEFDCSAESGPVMVIVTDVADLSGGDVAIWPSPARDELNVQMLSGTRTLTIHDGSGRVVLVRSTNGAERMVLPLYGLSAGTYFLRMENDQESSIYRFVKLP